MADDLRDYLMQRQMAAMGQKAPDPYHDYAGEQFKRENGTTKGKGFLGAFPLTNTPDPGLTSEYSVADSATGPDYPTLVPGLDASELSRLLMAIEFKGKVPNSVIAKARQHAAMRQAQGKDVFAQEGEQQTDTLPMFRRIK